jgi:steroid delta-isomerase-like uncharacterized protein
MMAVERESDHELAWAFAQRWVERWNAHDVEGVLALVSDDVSWEDPTIDGTAHGREASRRYIESLFRTSPDIAWAMPSGVCTSPRGAGGTLAVAQPWLCTGTVLGPIEPGFAPTGRAFRLEGVDLWELRVDEGVLGRVVSHYDALDFARRIGLMPARGGAGEWMLVQAQRLRERAMTRLLRLRERFGW